MARYTVGIDFGTLSARAVLVDVATGRELADSVHTYPHAVLERALPDGTPLGLDWALQVPQDYLEALRQVVPAVLAGVEPGEVIGLGIDCTSSTALPVLADGTPLCELPAFSGQPHAYAKLWKHHACQAQASRIQEVAEARQEPWLSRYGGRISSEWTFPKLLETLEEAPEVYEAMDAFIEAGDWLVWRLTGRLTRNACSAGYKALHHKRDGYPSRDFFRAVHPRLEHVAEEKLGGPILSPGEKAGELTAEAAAWLGLSQGTAVAGSCADAHVTMPAVGITGPGEMLLTLGTSACQLLVAPEEHLVPGMCGVVEDGIYPGLYAHEAGQNCVGDHFAWFLENCLPAGYRQEAQGQDLHAFLREKAGRLRPGESGLLALDWWNGNRSVLVDADLTGLMIGMTLATRPEEIYRALIEATAFGARKIVEDFRRAGLLVEACCASGGIARKDPMMMQIYADVLRMPVRISESRHGAALGSAICGAVAAGKARGGYGDLFEAARAMGRALDTAYIPIPENADTYDALYAEYVRLHDTFGRGGNDVMKRLKRLRKQNKEEEKSCWNP